MKRIALAAVAVCLFLAGCASQVPQTPAQISANIALQVKKACAVAQPAVASLQIMQAQLTAAEQEAQKDDVDKIVKAVTAVCTATVPAPPESLSDLANTVFPLLIKFVSVSSLKADDKTTIVIGLTLAQGGLAAALAQ